MKSSRDAIDVPISCSVILHHTQACPSDIFALPPLNPHQSLANDKYISKIGHLIFQGARLLYLYRG